MITVKQFKQKKKREREVRRKILRRRLALRRARKEEASQESQMEKEYLAGKASNTITNEQRRSLLEKMSGNSVKNLTIEEKNERDQILIGRMKSNILLLEELEKEYLAEKESRERTNDILEGEGAVTLKQKLDMMNEAAQQKLKDTPVAAGGKLIVPGELV